MELSQKGSYTSIEEFNRLRVELVWTSQVDLDLMVFYKTRAGKVGGVYSERYKGGEHGSLSESPFIALSGDAGVAAPEVEAPDDKREVLDIARLDHFEQLCVCAVNFTEAAEASGRVFADFDARVEVTTDKGEAFNVVLDSVEQGAVAMICKLLPTFLGSDLVNKSEVMSVERLREVAPGAASLELTKR